MAVVDPVLVPTAFVFCALLVISLLMAGLGVHQAVMRKKFVETTGVLPVEAVVRRLGSVIDGRLQAAGTRIDVAGFELGFSSHQAAAQTAKALEEAGVEHAVVV